MGTNLEATYALCQVLQPLLVAGAGRASQQQGPPADPISRASAVPTGDACIIFISSVAGGPLAGRSGSLYAASKAALNQLAKSFACEWAAQGVRVNSVAPWVTLTELGQQVRFMKIRVGVDQLLHIIGLQCVGSTICCVRFWTDSSCAVGIGPASKPYDGVMIAAL